MIVILIGYPGSQSIRKASQFLVEKYLPNFDVHWLCYNGEINGWSAFLVEYLKTLEDDKIIFALDDYLLSNYIDMDIYNAALARLDDAQVACVKLHRTSISEHLEYPVTTQYTVWKRLFLIDLLSQTTSPWDFEVKGSVVFNKTNKASLCLPEPALEYPTASALSKRWEGVRTDGNNPEDIEYLKQNGYL